MSPREVIFNIFFALSVWVCLSEGKKPLPKYIQACSKSAPDFDDCCLTHGRQALPFILKGDKEYNIPNLSPLIIPSLALDSNNFKLTLTDLYVNGLDNNELKQVKFDFNKETLIVKVFFPLLNLLGDGDIDGKILVLPLKGTGKLNLTAVGLDVTYSIYYNLVLKDNEEYFAIDKSVADFTAQRVYFDIKNLFGDNAELNGSVNKVFNDSWQELIEEIKPIITETITKVGNAIVSAFSSTIPYKDIILD